MEISDCVIHPLPQPPLHLQLYNPKNKGQIFDQTNPFKITLLLIISIANHIRVETIISLNDVVLITPAVSDHHLITKSMHRIFCIREGSIDLVHREEPDQCRNQLDSDLRKNGVVWKKFLKQTDPIGPTHFHLKPHQPVTNPHQTVDIDRFVHFLVLSPDPVVPALRRVHRPTMTCTLKLKSEICIAGGVTSCKHQSIRNQDKSPYRVIE